MTPKYDIEVNSFDIAPPIGKTFGFGAKGWVFNKEHNGKRKELYFTGEVWGRTKSEAEIKARELVEKWINTH